MAMYDPAGNPIYSLDSTIQSQLLSGVLSSFSGRYLKTRHGPIVKGDGSGAIADDPSDVLVSVNSVTVGVTAVLGLLGIIILDNAPSHNDLVTVRYKYLNKTRVEFRRLNSSEFTLNAGGERGSGLQSYLYRNVLIDPSLTNPTQHVGAAQPATPEEIGYYYEAFERAYSVALNDPNLLLLNSPYHKVSYPPFTRKLNEVFISYDANTVPDVDPTNPWVRNGAGTATIDSGQLVMANTTSGGFPTGKGFYFNRVEDLSYDYSMSYSFRSQVTSYTLDYDWSGVAAGYLDGQKLHLISFLESGGIKYVGILTNLGDISSISSYIARPLDWSQYHIYRLYRVNDQVQLFFDGSSSPDITVALSDLPSLDEIEVEIDFASGVFFGDLNRVSVTESRWDFIRYLIKPLNPTESKHTIDVTYDATQYPSVSTPPWWRIGSFGNDLLLSGTILVDKTSASGEPFSSENGIGSGEIYGYFRPEPFLTNQATIVTDWSMRAHGWTHGVFDRALGMFVNDGSKYLAVSYMSDSSIALISYSGQTLPENDPETPWSKTGSGTISVIDNNLRVVNASNSGVFWNQDDFSNSILGSTKSFISEFRLLVNSYVANPSDPNKFTGSRVSLFDTSRIIDILFTLDGSNNPLISLASNNTIWTSASFNWNDHRFHTYRILASKSGNLVTLLIDGSVAATLPYGTFSSQAGTAYIRFGSWGPVVNANSSDVEWDYINLVPQRSGDTRSVGIYLGGDSSNIANYQKYDVDFTSFHNYRLVREPIGVVSLWIDGVERITVPYETLPQSKDTFFDIPGAGTGIFWGSFDESNLALSEWDFVNYSIAANDKDSLFAPHHQILNKQNVMASPDHITTHRPHQHTNYETCSTGVPTSIYYDILSVDEAYTKLNVGTPPVPRTEDSYLTAVATPVSSLPDPINVTNDLAFFSTDGENVINMEVNERGKYDTLKMLSTSIGNEDDAIYPADDAVSAMILDNTGTVCFGYDGTNLPENTTYPDGYLNWTLEGTAPYTASVSGGNLFFTTTGIGSKTYSNYSPLFGSTYPVTCEFSMSVLQDISGGIGDSQIRFEVRNGLFTIRLGFKTYSTGKFVQISSYAVADGIEVLAGNIPFDWSSGPHTYKMIIDRSKEIVSIYIDGNDYLNIPFTHFIYFSDSYTSKTAIIFGPRFNTEPTAIGISEISLDYISFCTDRDDHYTMPSTLIQNAFYLNAYADIVYPLYTVPHTCLLNTTSIGLFTGSRANEEVPELQISGLVPETITTPTDLSVPGQCKLVYTFGGNILNDPIKTMLRDMVNGWLLNDFTPGHEVIII